MINILTFKLDYFQINVCDNKISDNNKKTRLVFDNNF